ncbi:septum formation initiator [Aeromicrobium marinum DSM 15272]|uniref:Septum formation initiator n=1 Tax=Aeromicrobium marinum DSM 15272 TaxID=585531 RepID=E2SBK5_9ACTN|nr:septum formation initiator [Aeromicrobium marinum DSM 15272]
MLLSIIVLLIASYTSSLRTFWDQRQEIRATEAEIVMRQQAIAELEDDAARWDDPAYVKQQARERFGWVLPGEVGYRVIGADGEVEGNAPRLAEPPSSEPPPWYDRLWSSVQTAGEDPVERAVEESVPDQVLEPAE